MGVTREHPLRRKTGGLGGRSRYYGRRNSGRPLLTEGAIGPANAGRSGAATRPARCDSGCNKGPSSESHRDAANRAAAWRVFLLPALGPELARPLLERQVVRHESV